MIGFVSSPGAQTYDVLIVGGSIMGAATAWFLTDHPDFNGRVLVVERDPTFEFASTTHTTSCIRQQFSNALNIKISQFAADFIKNLRAHMGGDERIPDLTINSFGYMYLANTTAFADILERNAAIQHANGVSTQLLSAQDIQKKYPFYSVEDILLGSINLVDEGYWDGNTLAEWWRRQSRERGVEYLAGEVVAVGKNDAGTRIESVTLKSGETIFCNAIVNACGARADLTAKIAGIDLPVEPRKRYSWIFKAEYPLRQDLPLTIDPSGVHVRENGGGTYQAGAHSAIDPRVDYTDFTMDFALWEDHVWPILATRIPQFESVKVQAEWAGHYAYNTLDQNAIVGPHPDLSNFYFLNGFSGHGLQQAPAMGRGTAELITKGCYETLDLSPFQFDRISQNKPTLELAVI